MKFKIFFIVYLFIISFLTHGMGKKQSQKSKKLACPTPLKIGVSNFMLYQNHILNHIKAEKFRNIMLEKDNDIETQINY